MKQIAWDEVMKRLEVASKICNDASPVQVEGPIHIGVDLGTADVVVMAVDDNGMPVSAFLEWATVVRDGVVVDYHGAITIVKRLVSMTEERLGRKITEASTSYPPGTDARLSTNILDAANLRLVSTADEPSCLARLARLDRAAVVDIGGGSTDIAVISMGGRVKAASLPVAGNAFDNCIAQYVQEKFQIAIGPLTAEQLKKQVACCTKSEFEGVMEVRGHSWETNLPARRVVYTRDLYEPVQELAARIAAAARNVLESTPPELAADVSSTGVLLTGGGSLLRGLASYIAGELHTDVAIAPDPLNCVARGTAISLSEGKYLTAGFRDATPKSWNKRLNHTYDPFSAE